MGTFGGPSENWHLVMGFFYNRVFVAVFIVLIDAEISISLFLSYPFVIALIFLN
jgi:hypothetical protein